MSKKDLIDFIHTSRKSIEVNKAIFKENGVTSVPIETYLEIQRALLNEIEKLVKDKEV